MLLERGIALAELGRIDDARDDFRTAILEATSAPAIPRLPGGARNWSSHWFVSLADRMEEGVGVDPATLALWNETLSSVRE